MFARNKRSTAVVVDDGSEDARALALVARSLDGLPAGADKGLEPLLELVRTSFGMDYGSAWRTDATGSHAVAQVGAVSAAHTELTTRFVDPGDGSTGATMCGYALRGNKPVLIDDVGEDPDQSVMCERGRVSFAAGVRSGFSFPVVRHGEVVAVLEFRARSPRPESAGREATLTALADVVALALRLIDHAAAESQTANDRAAVTTVVTEIGACADESSALAVALDTVRDAFGWGYGSYWALDEDAQVLRFAQESGSAGEEFRQVTLAASFAEGVGLSGRAWRSRDMVYVPDLGEINDCVRAPVAQRVGVKAGVCFPILVSGQVVGTMDFFSTESVALSPSRESALRNVAQLVAQRVEALRRTANDAASAGALMDTVGRLSADAGRAAEVAREAVAQAGEMGREVQALRESSDAVGNVIGIISRIADQTNLLALNATIEAARAGEVGRGFAVVASEVKELARETGEATERVRERIASIQSSTGAVAQGIDAVDATIRRMDDVQGAMAATLDEQAALARAFDAR